MPINLSARGETDIVVIEVMNQGPAISADALQVIFNPLVVRAGDVTATDPLPTSLGLGLFIAQEIVKGHGGTLRVSRRTRRGPCSQSCCRGASRVRRRAHGLKSAW
jgi:K+-sensing histidine kinase KdpD